MRLPSVVLAASLLAAPAWPRAEETPRIAGSEVPAPKRTKFTAPEYPPDAQARGLRGIVILELVIDTQGKVASATVSRSVPPFDEAALTAARKWEYEVTRLDGKPVPVRIAVPITFTMPIPRVTRQEGVPELLQGANPIFPPGGDRGGSVVAEVTLDAAGLVAEAEVKSGEPPFSEAVLQALRTWRFAPEGEGATVSFRLEADFVPGTRGGAPRVDLRLAGLRRSQSTPRAEAVPSPAVAAPSPEPEPMAPVSASPEPPAPAAATLPPPEPSSAPVVAPAAPRDQAPLPPPVEVLGPLAAPPLSVEPAPAPQVPVSAVRDVALSAGVPDLMKGRRPVVPPLARMTATTGAVEVRFAVDAAGASSVQDVSGPELLKEAAQQAVSTWVFRRTTAERLHLVASFAYGTAAATATVRKEE